MNEINLTRSSNINAEPTNQNQEPCPSKPTLRSETMESASESSLEPTTASTCCLTRCCTFIKNQIVRFFDWLCSLFRSKSATVEEEASKPATLADIQAAKKERQAYEKHSLGFIKNHFMDRYHNVVTVSEDVVYYCFVDAIEASIKFSQIEAINNRWQNSIDLLETAQKFKDSDIITEKRLEFELIKDEAHAINCLADAIDVTTQLDILFSEKGDISEASLTKKCKNLTETLAKPIFSQPLTNKSQIVMSFDFNSSPINIVDAICSWIEESQNSGEADRVRSRLDAVIKSLQVK